MGLRELKKRQTRESIYETAWRMFAARGFDRVTVAEVAREAQVSLATVFNYFPSKEDLFYGRMEAHGSRLVEAVRAREVGEPVLVAFRRHLDSAEGLLSQAAAGDSGAMEQLRTLNRLIAGSQALRARELLALARTSEDLAALLAAENMAAENMAAADVAAENVAAADVSAHAVANALMGVHRTLIDYVRKRILADESPAEVARDLGQASETAFALLARGLGDYGRKSRQS